MRAGPLLELLADATARGRPAVALSPRGLAELVGGSPDESWWAEQAPVLAAAGWRVTLSPTVVTFTPDRTGPGLETADPDAPATPAPDSVELQVAVHWRAAGSGPGLVLERGAPRAVEEVAGAGGWVATEIELGAVSASLADDELRALALAATRAWRRLRDLNPGWG